jgi:hypothetical protein
MEATKLRDDLQTLLADDLGTYTTSKGKVYPAIRIKPPLVDPSWKISGLELSIHEQPQAPATIPLTGEKLSKRWWNLELVQFDNSKGLRSAIDKIERYYPHVVVRTKLPTNTTFASAFISIYDPVFLGVSQCLA